jgi:aryl-alcohol dehydrogenase-like predicted oxidoreductase
VESRPLGQTGLAVAPLTLGTMTFGAQADAAASRSMVDLALERGVNFLDTANVYNAGRTEELLGEIIAGRRDRFLIASKVGIKMGDAADEQGLSPAAIRKGIEGTLRRLRTDYVDLYYLHQPDYSTPLESSLATMDELVRAGKVRHVACSNYASWQVCRLLWLAEKNGWQPIQAVQPMYNLLARGIEQELLPACREFRLSVVPYNPLAGGLLTGKHQPAAPLEGTRFERMAIYKDRYWHAANFAAIERLTQVAKGSGRSLARLAISWLLAQPAVTSVILGASKLEHLRENLAALDDPPLTAGALAACDAVWKELRGITPVYNR